MRPYYEMYMSKKEMNKLTSFLIDNEHKMYYYRGLSEFRQTPTVGEPVESILIGTMQSAQDTYEAWIKYFNEELLEGLKVE